jgi:transposase-like protein
MSKRHRRGVEQWRQIIGAQPMSGLTISAFCRERGISQPSFFAWRRRLDNGTNSRFVEVTPAIPNELPAVEAVEIRLRSQRGLLVRRGFDRDLLCELIMVLENLPAPSLSRLA